MPRLPYLLLLPLLWFARVPATAADLQTIAGVRLVETPWADGDSFRVRFPGGEEHTVRLYGADCFEWHVSDDTDARRLRAQRRYFGIAEYDASPVSSIRLAKSLGEAAAMEVRRLLAAPFRVHTAFADGGGDGKYKRIYGFVTTADGRDLATVLVEAGLARAYGVYRGSPQGASRYEYQELLKDKELTAAARRAGAWAHTDWDRLADERSAQRREDEEVRAALDSSLPRRVLDLNTAARDQLMRIPGIGEGYANAIIENRPYGAVDELLRVQGIGPKRLERIRRWVEIAPRAAP
jgi:endonuclease YncB( thermonuclease family)